MERPSSSSRVRPRSRRRQVPASLRQTLPPSAPRTRTRRVFPCSHESGFHCLYLHAAEGDLRPAVYTRSAPRTRRTACLRLQPLVESMKRIPTVVAGLSPWTHSSTGHVWFVPKVPQRFPQPQRPLVPLALAWVRHPLPRLQVRVQVRTLTAPRSQSLPWQVQHGS